MNLLVFGSSVLGFGAFLLLDHPLLLKWTMLRHVTSLLGSVALTIALWQVAGSGDLFGWPTWTTAVGWIVTVIGMCLLVYSVFIEIPLTLARRAGAGPRLVQTGTYALCRHPGVLWLAILLLGMLLIVQRTGFILLMLLWLVLDIVLVAVQDRIVFPRRFPEYEQYQRSTPFLIPTPTSVTHVFRRIVHATARSEDK